MSSIFILLAVIWRWLTVPRGHRPHRFYGAARRRGSRRGVAMLMAITCIAFMTVLVTEINYGARVRLLQAAHGRDELVAEQLARSGVNIYWLILIADKELGKQLDQFLPGMNLWEMVPVLNTGMMRMLFVGGGSVKDDEAEAFMAEGKVSEEVAEESRGGRFSDKNFLDFEGDFIAEISDEESRINLNRVGKACDPMPCTSSSIHTDPVANALFGLMSGEENDQWVYENDVDRWEIIGNLADWIDEDSDRATRQGGYEDNLYNRLEPPYLAKNGILQTLQEVRLVDGWEGKVWDRFGEQLTIYGDGKININTADQDMIRGVLSAQTLNDAQVNEVMLQYEQIMLMGSFGKPKEFVDMVMTVYGDDNEMRKRLMKLFKTKSKLFRVKSAGLVGDTTVNITAYLDFSSARGKLLYLRVD